MQILGETIILIVWTQLITNQAITIIGNIGGPHNETYHFFQNAVSWYEAYTVCETFGHTFQMIGPYQAQCLMNSLDTAYGHIHIWTGAVQPRYSENIYDVDKCEEVDYFVVDTDVIANNSYSICVSLDSDNPGQYFLENCEENNHFVCIDHGDAITTDGLFESLTSYTTFGDYNTETHYTPRFEDCIHYCKTRIECFASVFDSNFGDCRIMLDNTYNFLTRYELIVPYSNEPDPFGIFSLYVKTTRVHIELQNVTNIYQESFPCNFEYGYPSITGTITETGIMETTIGDEENSKININDINDITTQQTSSKEIITTQKLNSEEVITTQKQNSEDARMTQRPNPQESTTTEEIFSDDTSTTRDHNSEQRTTTEEQTFKDKSTTKRPTSDEITTFQILESEERQTTQEISSEERITAQKSNSQSGSTTTQEPNSEDGTMNRVLIHSTTIEPEGDASVTSVRCHCPQVCTPRTTTKNTTIEDLQKELIIDKKTFSSYKRSLICIKDFRSSTNAIGGFAIVILSVVFGILVLSDILLLFRSKANLTHII